MHVLLFQISGFTQTPGDVFDRKLVPNSYLQATSKLIFTNLGLAITMMTRKLVQGNLAEV